MKITSNGVFVNKAKDTFEKTIPFKVYKQIIIGGHHQAEHTHDYMQIWYVMNGRAQHCIHSSTYNLVRGNIFVIPPFINHKVMTMQDEEVEIIGCEFLPSFINSNIFEGKQNNALFDFAYLEPFLVENEQVLPRFQLLGKSQMSVEKLLKEMLLEYKNEDSYYEIHIKADLLKLLAIIAREYDKNKDSTQNEVFDKYRHSIELAIQYINDNYTNKLYIEEVCKIATMSNTYFSYLFKQITGKTFTEYVNNLRIRKATEMLIETQLSVSDICFNIGFNDTTYFNRVFKKETGLSPTEYKKCF